MDLFVWIQRLYFRKIGGISDGGGGANLICIHRAIWKKVRCFCFLKDGFGGSRSRSWGLEVGGTTTSESRKGKLGRLVVLVMVIMVQTLFEVFAPSGGRSFVVASCRLDLLEAIAVTS